MGSRRQIRLVLAVLVVGAWGCTDHDEDRAIERVLSDARSALLAGDGARACRLLTAEGRERALAFGTGLEPPPRSCAELARARLALAVEDAESTWREDLGNADLEVLSASDTDARAELRVQDPIGTASRWRVRLEKTRAGWRIDDSNAVPSDD